ncbi:hypothetical protein [Mycolicibacterium insubricum]|uniref:hypothetical protein n=1 Tax=Mycolicibacterium insubricum TaxID=444597 RepID=UPI0021F2EA38|nr:hypothetical protein [Mycolicibacterium insubricum]
MPSTRAPRWSRSPPRWSNLLVKTVLAVTAGGRRFGLGFAAGMAVPAVVFGGVLASTVAGL